MADNNLLARLTETITRWDAVTDHRTGTDGDRASDDGLAAAISKLGLEPVVDTFPFRRRQVEAATLTIGGRVLEGVPYFDGGTTDAQGITGRLSPLGGTGDIAVHRCGPSIQHPGTATLFEHRRSDRYRGLVALSAADDIRPGLALLNADDYDAPFGVPVLQIASEASDVVDTALTAGDPVRLTAHMSWQDTHARNLHSRIPGRDPELAPVVVMTPKSAWWTCTSERGGGIAVWFELMHHFIQQPPMRSMVFVITTGHELGHVGLDRYLASQPNVVRQAKAWVHLGANFAAEGSMVRFQASEAKWLADAQQTFADAGAPLDTVAPVGTRPFGEARNIYDAGGRYVSMLGSNPYFHHPDDRWPAAIDINRTGRLATAWIQLVSSLVNA